MFKELEDAATAHRPHRLSDPSANWGIDIFEDEKEEEQALIVSWKSLEAKKQAYDHLINVEIPKNIEDISIARSYGDLRENFEFKSAKEFSAVLQRRKFEMERDLQRAQGADQRIDSPLRHPADDRSQRILRVLSPTLDVRSSLTGAS